MSRRSSINKLTTPITSQPSFKGVSKFEPLSEEFLADKKLEELDKWSLKFVELEHGKIAVKLVGQKVDQDTQQSLPWESSSLRRPVAPDVMESASGSLYRVGKFSPQYFTSYPIHPDVAKVLLTIGFPSNWSQFLTFMANRRKSMVHTRRSTLTNAPSAQLVQQLIKTPKAFMGPSEDDSPVSSPSKLNHSAPRIASLLSRDLSGEFALSPSSAAVSRRLHLGSFESDHASAELNRTSNYLDSQHLSSSGQPSSHQGSVVDGSHPPMGHSSSHRTIHHIEDLAPPTKRPKRVESEGTETVHRASIDRPPSNGRKTASSRSKASQNSRDSPFLKPSLPISSNDVSANSSANTLNRSSSADISSSISVPTSNRILGTSNRPPSLESFSEFDPEEEELPSKRPSSRGGSSKAPAKDIHYQDKIHTAPSSISKSGPVRRASGKRTLSSPADIAFGTTPHRLPSQFSRPTSSHKTPSTSGIWNSTPELDDAISELFEEPDLTLPVITPRSVAPKRPVPQLYSPLPKLLLSGRKDEPDSSSHIPMRSSPTTRHFASSALDSPEERTTNSHRTSHLLATYDRLFSQSSTHSDQESVSPSKLHQAVASSKLLSSPLTHQPKTITSSPTPPVEPSHSSPARALSSNSPPRSPKLPTGSTKSSPRTPKPLLEPPIASSPHPSTLQNIPSSPSPPHPRTPETAPIAATSTVEIIAASVTPPKTPPVGATSSSPLMPSTPQLAPSTAETIPPTPILPIVESSAPLQKPSSRSLLPNGPPPDTPSSTEANLYPPTPVIPPYDSPSVASAKAAAATTAAATTAAVEDFPQPVFASPRPVPVSRPTLPAAPSPMVVPPATPHKKNRPKASSAAKVALESSTAPQEAINGERAKVSAAKANTLPASDSTAAIVSSTRDNASSTAKTASKASSAKKDVWTEEQIAQLQEALSVADPTSVTYLSDIVSKVPGKTVEQVKKRMAHSRDVKGDFGKKAEAKRTTATGSPLKVDDDMSKKKNRKKLALALAQDMETYENDAFEDTKFGPRAELVASRVHLEVKSEVEISAPVSMEVDSAPQDGKKGKKKAGTAKSSAAASTALPFDESDQSSSTDSNDSDGFLRTKIDDIQLERYRQRRGQVSAAKAGSSASSASQGRKAAYDVSSGTKLLEYMLRGEKMAKEAQDERDEIIEEGGIVVNYASGEE